MYMFGHEAEGQTIEVLSDEDFEAAVPEVEDLEDEVEEVAEVEEAPQVKVTKTVKKSTRPPVPEGFIAPVAFAKVLSAYYTDLKRDAGLIAADEEVVIPPQYVYSIINAGRKPNARHPLPTYTEGGRNNLLKSDEALEWFQKKDERIKARGQKAAKVKPTKAEAATVVETVVEDEAVDAVDVD